MDKQHSCFTNLNQYAYAFAEIGIIKGKDSYNAAYKQFFVVINHYKK